MAEYFSFYISWRDAIRDLPDDVRLEVYEAAIEYAATGIQPALKPLARVAFNFIKDDIDRQNQRSQELSDKRANAVRQRWAKRNGSESAQENTKDTNVDFVSQTNTNDTNVKDVDFVSHADTNDTINRIRIENNKNKKSLSVSLPFGGSAAERENFNLDEIFLLFFNLNRKDPHGEAQRFHDHYASQNWCKGGGQRITDIAAVARLWKCSDMSPRFENNISEFLNAVVMSAPAEQQTVLAAAVRGARYENGAFVLSCTDVLADFIENNIDQLKPIYQQKIGKATLEYKITKI